MLKLLFLAAAASAAGACGSETRMDDRIAEPAPAAAAENARARDGDIAIAQEMEAARKAGTVAAYELFLARHPRHELAGEARAELDRLKGRRR
jgi:hypothetical protein